MGQDSRGTTRREQTTVFIERLQTRKAKVGRKPREAEVRQALRGGRRRRRWPQFPEAGAVKPPRRLRQETARPPSRAPKRRPGFCDPPDASAKKRAMEDRDKDPFSRPHRAGRPERLARGYNTMPRDLHDSDARNVPVSFARHTTRSSKKSARSSSATRHRPRRPDVPVRRRPRPARRRARAWARRCWCARSARCST